MAEDKVSYKLSDFDLTTSRVLSYGFQKREIRLSNSRRLPIRIDFNKNTPEEIEAELKRGIEVGCNYDKIEAIKADYYIWNMVNDRLRAEAMIVVSDETQEIATQEDGTLLSESDLAQIDNLLAKCEKYEDIAIRFGTSIETIRTREHKEHQAIIDLRRRLNVELEDSAIGLAHDFVRLEELQETLEIIKAHIVEYETTRNRKDLAADEKLLRMSAIPNIISLLNTKEKIIASASKEMKSRKEAASSSANEFDLSESEQLMFEEIHQKLPIMELVVARASVDNGWNSTYMIEKLNKSIYRNFRKGFIGDDVEIIHEKNMELPYPSTEPVKLDEVITSTVGRDHDKSLMQSTDAIVPDDKRKALEIKKQEILDKIKANRDENKGQGGKEDNATNS